MSISICSQIRYSSPTLLFPAHLGQIYFFGILLEENQGGELEEERYFLGPGWRRERESGRVWASCQFHPSLCPTHSPSRPTSGSHPIPSPPTIIPLASVLPNVHLRILTVKLVRLGIVCKTTMTVYVECSLIATNSGPAHEYWFNFHGTFFCKQIIVYVVDSTLPERHSTWFLVIEGSRLASQEQNLVKINGTSGAVWQKRFILFLLRGSILKFVEFLSLFLIPSYSGLQGNMQLINAFIESNDQI